MGFISVIKYEGNNQTFVYKHPTEDFNSGTQLIVHESQEAVFFRDGKALDRFGPGKYTLETESLPGVKKFYGKVADGPSQFHAEIYFINLVTIMGVKWGTDSKVRMFDPATGLHLELGAFGEFNIRVSDSGKILLKIVGTELGLKKEEIVSGGSGYSTTSVSGKFRALVMTKVKSFLPKAIRENNIDILEVDEHLDEISEYLREQLNGTFESYGLTLPEFYVTSISTPDDDPNFRRLKQQHADRYLKIQEERIKTQEAEARKGRLLVEAETEAEVKIVGAKAEAEATRAQGFAKADVMRAQGFTYQQETQREIGTRAAENESAGGGSIASSLVQAGVGLGVGVAVAKETVGAVNGVMHDANGPTSPTGAWKCPVCGAEGNTGNFCGSCGSKRPAPQAAGWKCPVCGHEGNQGKFCEQCGAKRQMDQATWKCPNCGHDGNTGNFCAECGTKKEQ